MTTDVVGNEIMSNFNAQLGKMKERQEKDKTRREKLASFFFNLAQVAFAGLVIGWISPLSSTADNVQSWAVLGGGIAFTVIFALIGNKILK